MRRRRPNSAYELSLHGSHKVAVLGRETSVAACVGSIAPNCANRETRIVRIDADTAFGEG